MIDYDKRLFAYQMAMALARSMRSKGLISAKEYAKIDTIIDSDMVRSKITAIRAEKNNVVVYCMDDGSEIVKRWKDRSRAESWTPEMKEKARQRALQARRKKE